MNKRQIIICPACNRASEILWDQSHGFCSFCKNAIDPFFSDETANEKNKDNTKKQ
jgi:hypothetical protein